MKIGFAQINPTVGDLSGNFERIVRAYERLAAAGAELVLTPELALTGYPPQDLVFKSRFVSENLAILEKLHARVGEAALLVRFVDRNEGRGKPFRNAAALLERGKPIRKAYKSLLPTYDVFDEDRYFEPAGRVEPFEVRGKKIGVTICEDEKVVDTDSTATIEFREGKPPQELFAALSLGVRDYFRKCNFHSAVVGLSGGVDSAVTAVIAVDALGAENVTGVSMPSPYSSRGSIDDARALARN